MQVTSEALIKSGRVHKAFCRLYLPFHDLTDDFFLDHFGVFACIEAWVYEKDDWNEVCHPGSGPRSISEIAMFIEKQQLHSAYFSIFLRSGIKYWQLERRLAAGVITPIRDVLVAARLRSFDFRLLHLAAIGLAGTPINRQVFRKFAQFEAIMELDDDLRTIEDDQDRKVFNIASLVQSYGQDYLTRYKLELISRFRMTMEKETKFRLVAERYMDLVPRSILVQGC